MPDARSRTDRTLAVAAVVAALAAVGVASYQASLSREQQRASAWPYLTQANSWVPENPYTRSVENAGVGPARVRSFRVLVDGEPRAWWGEVVEALAGEPEPALVTSWFGRGSVLPSGAERVVLTLPPGPRAAQFWEAAQTRLTTVVCYCSVYDECWVANSRADEPEPVGTCAYDAATEMQD